MLRHALVAVSLFACVPAARAHVVLEATMDTAEEIPAPFVFPYGTNLDTTQEVTPPTVGTPSPTGIAKFALLPDDTLRYEFTTQNLTGPATEVNVYESPPGAENPTPAFQLELDGSGTTPALSEDRVTALQTGNLYINVLTAANPAGEIRGQIGASPAPSATAQFEYDPETNTLDYTITPANLSGAVVAAHLHTGNPGATGPVAQALDNTLSGSLTSLTEQQVSDLYDGKLYVNVHTAVNPDGEIRGQVTIAGTAACRCDGTRKAYLRCVRRAIKALDKDDRKLASVKAIRKAAGLGTCGRTKGPRRAIACCLPQTPTENLVFGRQCAALKESACTRQGGTSLGAGSSCFPTNPCTPPASPSGAFVDTES
jgi:hypothetical protein